MAGAEANLCTPSVIFIRPTVWPQYTNVRDRTYRQTGQDRQTDNGPIALDEPFYKRSLKNPKSLVLASSVNVFALVLILTFTA